MGDHHLRESPFVTMRSASSLMIDVSYSCIVSSGEYFSSVTDHSFSLSIQSGMASFRCCDITRSSAVLYVGKSMVE
jgi:hypothetical protein